MQVSRSKKSLEIARKKYEMFHGRQAKKILSTNFHVPEYLVLLGDAHAIEYRSTKRNGGGDGTRAIYVHPFESDVKLYMDERCGKALYLLGAKLKVTDAGIEN